MTIHDAIYEEAPDEEVKKARNLIKTQIQSALEMPIVPLEVDIEVLPPRSTG
jgi:DNA polymerase I-like protein with 3'-5' exonuclease and polymerase domains